MYKFKFADIGEGLHEGGVGEIYVKVGDKVEEGDSLFSVETDKVTSDIPSPVTGKVAEILIKTGETVHVGDDVFHFETEGGAEAPAPVEEKKEEEKKEVVSEDGASVVGEVKVSNEIVNNQFATASSSSIKSDGILATPLARKIAAKNGVNISNVKGTGTNGKVLVKDVLNGGSSTGQATKIAKTPGQTTRVAIPRIRQATAKALKNSWDNVAYVNLVTEVDMTTLWDQRKAVLTTKQAIEKLGVKVTFLPFIIKAVTMALEEFPMFNSQFDEKANEFVQYHDKNVGIAVDTPNGLFVPVIKQAETKSLVEISNEIISLATKAKAKKLAMSEMTGGTFTVTNYGTAGALWGVPVINYPELAILGTGSIVDKVVAKDGGFTNRKVMYLTIATDHRWIDGADAGRFTQRIKKILENPISMIGEFQNV